MIQFQFFLKTEFLWTTSLLKAIIDSVHQFGEYSLMRINLKALVWGVVWLSVMVLHDFEVSVFTDRHEMLSFILKKFLINKIVGYFSNSPIRLATSDYQIMFKTLQARPYRRTKRVHFFHLLENTRIECGFKYHSESKFNGICYKIKDHSHSNSNHENLIYIWRRQNLEEKKRIMNAPD